MKRWLFLVVFGLSALALVAEEAPAPRAYTDLTGYRSVKELVPVDPKLVKATPATFVRGYLGVGLGANAAKEVVLDDVLPETPASEAGLKAGMVVLALNGEAVKSLDQLRDAFRGLPAGEPATLRVKTSSETLTIKVTPKAVSKPFSTTTAARPLIGITAGDKKDGGVEVEAVTEGGAAEKAGVKKGDVLLKIDESKLDGDVTVRDLVSAKKPGDSVRLLLKRKAEEMELRVILGADTTGAPGAARTASWDDRLPTAWKKPTYKLAIIGVEYPDVKHNAKIEDKDWEASMFSIGAYKDKSATGQKVYGSMADYYREISYGKFNIEGHFVGWVEVSKKRAEYSSGSGTSTREKSALLTESMDKVLEKKGKDALKDYDGVFFIYAGERVNTTRGSLYWPHRASVSHQGKRWPYFIVQEGGPRMNDISVFCHEFGHMLGLPDLYARPEVPGMEGVGPWCAMSQQNGQGRPQHFSAWSKDQLGWVQPKTIDPRVKQKVVLNPIEDSPTECVKVLLRADGTEYFLLENRRKKGFDSDLPAEGLLIWRVMPNNATQRVFLEEAHGVEGQTGPRVYLGAVPFPSPANTSFTPTTTPSSKSQLGGGWDVHITNIRRLPDGRVTFHIGYEYQ
ncbi:MAG: M6 family metalloprotease domain-containing protein [Fimbriiglobus sp.]